MRKITLLEESSVGSIGQSLSQENNVVYATDSTNFVVSEDVCRTIKPDTDNPTTIDLLLGVSDISDIKYLLIWTVNSATGETVNDFRNNLLLGGVSLAQASAVQLINCMLVGASLELVVPANAEEDTLIYVKIGL